MKTELIKKNWKHPKKILATIGALISAKLKVEKPLFLPPSVDIEPTIRCNLKCKFCQVPTWNRKADDLTFEQFKRILDQFPNLIKLKLQGMGETFINKDIFKMIDYAAGKDLFIKTTTNATLLNPDMCKKIIISKLDELVISLDGSTKETYEAIRKGAKFDDVIKKIEYLSNLKKKFKSGPKLSVWFVGTELNMKELPDLVKLCKKLGLDQLTIQTSLNMWGDDAL